jgi:hypothetical protein
METFIALVSIPIMVLNFFGGIVAGIWLIVLGKWSAFFLGLFAVFFSSWGLAIALMPSVGLGILGLRFLEKQQKAFGYFFALLGQLYTFSLLSAWCVGVLQVFLSMSDSSSKIPLVIWSYGVATGPWTWMAQQEQRSGDSPGSMLIAFFAQVGFIVMMMMVLFFDASVTAAAEGFTMIMLVPLVICWKLMIDVERQSSGRPEISDS